MYYICNCLYNYCNFCLEIKISMKKIVITGGSGDIAQVIAKKLDGEYDIFSPGKNILDVTNIENVIEYFSLIGPDILINNAGFIKPKSILSCSYKEFVKHFKINLFGTFICSKYAILNGCKLIINIGSSAGSKGKKDWSAYCCSKAAVNIFTESLYAEDVKTVCISPGRTNTKMRSNLFKDEDPNTLLDPKDFADIICKILEYPKFFYGKNLHVHKNNKKVECFFTKEVINNYVF